MSAQLIEAPRVRALDALRGVAISLVVFHHVGLRFNQVERDGVGSLLVESGWAGVDLFFAISGYLIVKALLKDRGKGWLGAFMIRRVFRIVPLYLIALVGFYPTNTDTSVKPHDGAGGVSCNSGRSTAKSSSVRLSA